MKEKGHNKEKKDKKAKNMEMTEAEKEKERAYSLAYHHVLDPLKKAAKQNPDIFFDEDRQS